MGEFGNGDYVADQSASSPVHYGRSRATAPRGEKTSVEQATMLRRFIAEHAHRMIIAAATDDSVQELRPRTISSHLLRSEEAQWQGWHENQSTAERRLMGW